MQEAHDFLKAVLLLQLNMDGSDLRGEIDLRALLAHGGTMPCTDDAEGFLGLFDGGIGEILPPQPFRDVKCLTTEKMCVIVLSA